MPFLFSSAFAPPYLPSSISLPFLFSYDLLFSGFAFVFGAVVGSFLNVCIYRMPLGLSVNEPKRSFCPLCKAPIAWYHNLPIAGWLWLRGRCANCHKPISPRYPAIELLTGLLFLAVWRQFQDTEWILVLPAVIFVSLLVVATFIDFDHFIIPDEITIGGTVAGLVLSFAIPQMMGTDSHPAGLLWSAVAAAAGFATLFAVVEGGKLAFGKKRVTLPEPLDFHWKLEGENDATIQIGPETDRWSELFGREKDQMILHCDRLSLAGKEHGATVVKCFYNRLEAGGKTYPLDGMTEFSGRLREYVFPREAMGFGDVKFIAAIGAFLGWRAVFFSIASASLIGSVFGVGLLLLGPKARSLKIPFGPYLSVGALLWLFAGPRLVHWYLNLIHL